MNTQSIQEVIDERASQNSEQLEDVLSIHSQRPSEFNNNTNDNLISTTDILNHDYNQMKIEEGRLHRLNQKKELKSSSNNENSELFLTQVTLNLDIVANRPKSESAWKYNSIKRTNSNQTPKTGLNTVTANTAHVVPRPK
jgi:hypothetical protein